MVANLDRGHDRNCARPSLRLVPWGTGARILLVAVAIGLLYWWLLRIESVRAYGIFGFWLSLLAPLWLPAMFARNWSRWAWLRMLFALPAVACYLLLILLSQDKAFLDRRFLLWWVTGGSALSVGALAFAHQGFWRLVSLPLGLAIICGTISLWCH
jgi:hypothetical protein